MSARPPAGPRARGLVRGRTAAEAGKAAAPGGGLSEGGGVSLWKADELRAGVQVSVRRPGNLAARFAESATAAEAGKASAAGGRLSEGGGVSLWKADELRAGVQVSVRRPGNLAARFAESATAAEAGKASAPGGGPPEGRGVSLWKADELRRKFLLFMGARPPVPNPGEEAVEDEPAGFFPDFRRAAARRRETAKGPAETPEELPGGTLRNAALAGASLAALAVLCLIPGHAESRSCDPTDNDRMEAVRVISRIAARIDVMEERVVEALRLQTAQQTGYQAQSAKALAQALDAQTRLQAQTAREVEETRAVRARAPSANACATATGVAGLRAARDASEAARREAGRVETGRIANDRAVAPSPGAAADADARFGALTSAWCSPGRAGDAACKGEDDRHAADLKAGETLFDRRTIASQDELRAAVELARNLAAPVVHDPPPLSSAETPEERRLVLLGRSADARSALAADYFAALRALRAPAAGLGAWAEAVAPGARDPAKPVSRYELLELLAARRYEDPAWTVGLQAMGAENLLREIAILLGLQLQLDWQRFRLDERRGGLAAAGLALGAEEMRRLPGLDNPAAGAN